jgi:hypothetical protein
MALPDGLFGAIAGKKSLPPIEVAPARPSEGSLARCQPNIENNPMQSRLGVAGMVFRAIAHNTF